MKKRRYKLTSPADRDSQNRVCTECNEPGGQLVNGQRAGYRVRASGTLHSICRECEAEGARARYDASRVVPPRAVEHPVERLRADQQRERLRAEHESMARELDEAQRRQAFLDEMSTGRGTPRILPREKSSGMREMAAVVLASDWHVEETVEPETVGGVNAYDLEIAEKRIRRFFEAIIWNVEHQRASKRVAVRDVVLWLGGDLMTGYIHEELIESNSLSPTQTIRWLRPKLRDGILTLQSRLDLASIVVPCSYGNHGRTTLKPRISTGYKNSYEWLMYLDLADELRREKTIRFEVTSSPHQYVQAYDWSLHFHHGDDVKYAGGVGGITIPLKKRIPMWDRVRRCDYHHVGHFHEYLDHGNFTVNGSLIGYGPYSQRIGAAFEEPQQAFYMLDSKRGKCMKTPLWVDGEQPRKAVAR